jgi:hypothetical protein
MVRTMQQKTDPRRQKYVAPLEPEVAAKKFFFLFILILGFAVAVFGILSFIPKSPNYSVKNF